MRNITRNDGNLISKNKRALNSINKTILLLVFALIAFIIWITATILLSSSEGQIMAPLPAGSSDSVTKPLA